MTNNLQLTTNKGFTIVESLVAISILVLAITGATSAIQTGISSYIFSKDQIIAFYLAQEGFEQIRNIRDENGLKKISWWTGLGACFSPSACTVDPVVSSVPSACTPGSCQVLKQDPSTGFFGYTSGSDTIFRREIVLTSINAHEILVLVTVNWSKGTMSKQFRAKENLLDWQ